MAELAGPLDQRVIRLDHLEAVGAIGSVSHDKSAEGSEFRSDRMQLRG